MLYRIYTEQHRKLPEIISRYVDGCTMLYGQGFWKGKPESCVVIEIDSIDYEMGARVRAICKDIKVECEQEEVIMQTSFTSTTTI